MDLDKIKLRWDYKAKLSRDKLKASGKEGFLPMISNDRKDVWNLIEEIDKLREILNGQAKANKPEKGADVQSKDSQSHNLLTDGRVSGRKAR